MMRRSLAVRSGGLQRRIATSIPERLQSLIQGYCLPPTLRLSGVISATPAPTPTSSAVVKPAMESRWDCPYCSHSNHPNAHRCSMCAAPREGRAKGMWLCGSSTTCGHLNPRHRSACERCDTPFGGTREWTCQSCLAENTRLSVSCRDCKALQVPTWQCKSCQIICSVFASHCEGCGTQCHFVSAKDKQLRECKNCHSRVLPTFIFCNVCAASLASHVVGTNLEVMPADLPSPAQSPPPAAPTANGIEKSKHGGVVEVPPVTSTVLKVIDQKNDPPGQPSGNKPPKPPMEESPPILWTCQRCSTPHRSLDDCCSRCGKVRVSALHKARTQDTWQCRTCGIFNPFSQSESCQQCGAAGGPRLSNCPHCNEVDQPFRKACNSCGEVTSPTASCETCGRTTTIGPEDKCVHCFGAIGRKIGHHVCTRCGTAGVFSCCIVCGKNNSTMTWICKCGMGNNPTRVVCQSCSLPMSKKALVVPSWWTCPTCSTANSAMRQECKKCKGPRSFGDQKVPCQTCSQSTRWGPSQLCDVCGSSLVNTHNESTTKDNILLSTLVTDPIKPSQTKSTKKRSVAKKSAKASGKVCDLCGAQSPHTKAKECAKCGMPL